MSNKIKTIILMFTTLINFNTAFALQQQSQSIIISDPWVRLAPSNARVLAAFMEIHNYSDDDVKLLSASAYGYQRVELHRTLSQNGMMQMVKQDFMLVPAHGKLTLEPGSWHVMMIKPKSVPSKGRYAEIRLLFDNGLSKTVYAKVKEGKMMHHKQMMHHRN